MSRPALRPYTNHRLHGIGRPSTEPRQDNCRLGTPVGEKYFEDREARERITGIVCQFTPRQLAKASGRSVDAAKKWIAGERTPDTASMVNMARRIPAIRKWLMHEIGETAEFDDPRMLAREIAMHMQQLKE